MSTITIKPIGNFLVACREPANKVSRERKNETSSLTYNICTHNENEWKRIACKYTGTNKVLNYKLSTGTTDIVTECDHSESNEHETFRTHTECKMCPRKWTSFAPEQRMNGQR